MNNDQKFIIMLICSFLIGFSLSILIRSSWIYKQPKERIVEVPPSLVINVPQKYDLTGTEYIKRVFNDITITSYNNHANQTDNTPNITSTNRLVRENMVAISPDFLNKGLIKYGDLIYVDCMKQWYVVEDVMNSKFEKRLDIFLFNKTESLKINKKCNIEVIHVTK